MTFIRLICLFFVLISCKSTAPTGNENQLKNHPHGSETVPAISVPKNIGIDQLSSESSHCGKLAMIGYLDYQAFKNLGPTQRLNQVFGAHVQSAKKFAEGMDIFFDPSSSQSVRDYVDTYISKTHKELIPRAVKSTLQFVLPDRFLIELRNHGSKALLPTITRKCGVFVNERVKGVHALGAVAKVKWKFSSDDIRTKYFSDDVPKELKSLMRFSLANPIVPNADVVKHFDLATQIKVNTWLNLQPGIPLLEFIPGLGIQVFLKSKTFGFVAMESLAGQANDHNYFKYSFSPDFSDHAPLDHINRDYNPDLVEMESRYKRNPLNSLVMNIVGKRFKEVLKRAKSSHRLNSSEHVDSGPFKTNTFRIRTDGYFTKDNVRRLIFRPIVKRESVVNSDQYAFDGFAHRNDFRQKLANLEKDDDLYAVDVELYGTNADGSSGPGIVEKNVAVIKMDSKVFPSHFGAFRLFFGHKLAKEHE